MFAVDYPTVGVGGALLGLVVYFLKKTDRKVDRHDEKIVLLSAEFEELKTDVKTQIVDMRSDLKDDMAEIFNTICHERQDSCGRLRDAKLVATEQRVDSACQKIRKLEEDRRDDWSEQRRWNGRMEDRFTTNRTGGQGK